MWHAHIRAAAPFPLETLDATLTRATFIVEVYLDRMELPPMFEWLKEAGNVANAEMLRTFNCGIGMVLVCEVRYIYPYM